MQTGLCLCCLQTPEDRFSCVKAHMKSKWQTVSQVKINKNFQPKIVNISYPSVLTYVLGAQKNPLIETVLLSTHSICFA